MSNKKDELYKKLQALNTLAERASNQHEAAAAANAAAKLIAKYNLDEDLIRDWSAPPVINDERVYLYKLTPLFWKRKSDKDKREERRKKKSGPGWFERKRKYAPRSWPPSVWYEYGHTGWFQHLAEGIARVCGVEAPIYGPGSVVFVGEPERTAQAAFLMSNIFSRMLVMAEQEIKAYCVSYKAEHGKSPYRESGYAHPAQFRQGWLEACSSEIASKLYDIDRERRKEAMSGAGASSRPANALMVKDAIALYIADQFAYVRDRDVEDTDKTRPGSAAGSLAGYKAGKQFGLQDGVGEGGPIAALKPGKE